MTQTLYKVRKRDTEFLRNSSLRLPVLLSLSLDTHQLIDFLKLESPPRPSVFESLSIIFLKVEECRRRHFSLIPQSDYMLLTDRF